MQTVSWANQENGNLASGDQTQPIHTLPIRKVEQFPTPDSTTGTAMAMAEKAETEEVQPQFSDEVLLQDIYAAIDMTRYALNETSPRWKERPISKRELPFEEYRDHPYLHLFPHLQRHIEDIQEEANATQKSHPKKFQYQLYFQRNDPTAQSNFIGRYGIEHFLAPPMVRAHRRKRFRRTTYRRIQPQLPHNPDGLQRALLRDNEHQADPGGHRREPTQRGKRRRNAALRVTMGERAREAG